MSTTTARIATARPGYCDACDEPFLADRQGLLHSITHEFVFTSRGGSFVAQYATCAQCHEMRQPGALSAPPLRAQVNCPPKFNLSNSTYRINGTIIDCTEGMGEFLARSVVEVRFAEDAAA